MTRSSPFQAVLLTSVAFGALCASARLAEAATYIQTDLVSDISGLAEVTDSSLRTRGAFRISLAAPSGSRIK